MRLGVSDLSGLLHYYPRDYEFFSKPEAIYELTPGQMATVAGILTKEPSMNYYRGMQIVNAALSDMTGRLQLSWYHLPYIKKSLKTGVPYVFRGRLYEKNGRLILQQPRVYEAEAYAQKLEGRLLPVYPLTKGMTNALLRKTEAEALRDSALLRDWLPARLREAYGLCTADYALRQIHFPESREALLHARSRICFEEFFLFFLGIQRLKAGREQKSSDYRMKPDLRLLRFMADLPFSLTEAQQKAFREITADISSGRVMNRLLEGDVGSGKTIVALLSMLYAGLNGCQSVLMAPTEVLAAQHYANIVKALNRSDLPLSAVLLTGSMTAAERRAALIRIREHEADLIVGTHAVFQAGVSYDRLGLVVTDEQHRFGVAQRDALREKGGEPHMLVMSATPIPRTLATILYGDLNVSVIDKLPSGRLPIKNCVVGVSYRRTAWRFIEEEAKKGHQAYVICPMIEKEAESGEDGVSGDLLSGSSSLENAVDYEKRLRQIFPEEVRTGLLHGRMNAKEKERVMRAFQNNEIQVLVSTTVVEVGVDVPNATVMMIENAERFGLAQLHQLRGRVGRGSEQSYCIMLNSSDSEKAAERLAVLNHSNDGFYIANEDLRLRGPGDLFGVRQSGELSFGMADIYQDAELLKKAKQAAEDIEKKDAALKAPEHQALSARLSEYLAKGQG